MKADNDKAKEVFKHIKQIAEHHGVAICGAILFDNDKTKEIAQDMTVNLIDDVSGEESKRSYMHIHNDWIEKIEHNRSDNNE